jgi:hypothetical protein
MVVIGYLKNSIKNHRPTVRVIYWGQAAFSWPCGILEKTLWLFKQ